MKERNTRSISDKKSSIGVSIPPTAVDRKIDYWSATIEHAETFQKKVKKKEESETKENAAKTA